MVSIFTIHHHLWISPCLRVWGKTTRATGTKWTLLGCASRRSIALWFHSIWTPKPHISRPSPVYRLSRTDTNDVVGFLFSSELNDSRTTLPLFTYVKNQRLFSSSLIISHFSKPVLIPDAVLV
ncbi:hypothetical protein QR685DRAFT_245552 [Neurospora intermedia]|uniref:Uncharacterized protein n=1 Tax=Neurospora intermedia TaxID=5142 RepID=A0ABR3DBX0_NEUIN